MLDSFLASIIIIINTAEGSFMTTCMTMMQQRHRKHNAHQSCSRTVLSSKYMVLERKSMPMVACICNCLHQMRAWSRLQRLLHHCKSCCPTWYVLSNLSYMNRVMMLVLPTD